MRQAPRKRRHYTSLAALVNSIDSQMRRFNAGIVDLFAQRAQKPPIPNGFAPFYRHSETENKGFF